MSEGNADTGGADVGLHLRQELERLAHATPCEALGVPQDATAERIRATFLELTKRYHPNRFARMDRETVRLANEVFLRVKDAYAQLGAEARRAKLAEGSAAQAVRATTATWHPGTATPRPQSPVVSQRAGERAAPRTTPSEQTQRPVPARAGTVRGVRPATTRGQPRQQRTTDAEELERGLRDTLRHRNEEYEAALRLLSQGRYRDAREVLHKIAADDPKTKKYRVQMHYAWGLEHEDAGRFDDARRELERALAVDPEFKRAHEALDRLPGGKKDGFFKKLFGR